MRLDQLMKDLKATDEPTWKKKPVRRRQPGSKSLYEYHLYSKKDEFIAVFKASDLRRDGAQLPCGKVAKYPSILAAVSSVGANTHFGYRWEKVPLGAQP